MRILSPALHFLRLFIPVLIRRSLSEPKPRSLREIYSYRAGCLGSTGAGTRARRAICIGEVVYMPPCGLSLTANIAGPIGLVGVWPKEFPVCGCVENVATAEDGMCH